MKSALSVMLAVVLALICVLPAAAHDARARAACQEKARLRNLGGSSSLAHGWEDLPFTLSA